MTQPHHLVVGAGAVGTAVARLLAGKGERVRVVTRSGSGPDDPQIERVRADASDAERLARLAEGASAVYNCANPPYSRWTTDWPPLAAALLGAAERAGAVLATTSNLYGYGPCPMPMTEATPLAATTRKGRVRADMWREALTAHEAGRVRVTEVRASDYLGETGQSYIHDRVVPALLAGRTARVLGDPDAPHTWTYTRDTACLLVTAAQDERAWGRAWHVPSHGPATSRELAADLCRTAGVPVTGVSAVPRWLLRMGGLTSPVLRELGEMMYQHDRPFVMDSTAARAAFGLEPTPWDEILAATVGRAGRAHPQPR